MKKIFIVIVIFGLPCSTWVDAGNITYKLCSYASDFDYIITGTITTNGHIGYISCSDFVSWSWMVTSPSGFSYSGNSSEMGWVLSSAGLYANQRAITLFFPDPSLNTQNNVLFRNPWDATWSLPEKCLGYATGSNRYPYYDGNPIDIYYQRIILEYKPAQTDIYSISVQQSVWFQQFSPPYCDVAIAIPEPCTLGLLALGGVLVSRRRANR
jgi:hypothetical protein